MLNTLVVDNNICYRQALTDMLLVHFPSIVVDEANDGYEALCKVEYQRPHIILMNAQLPGESGLELTRKIKSVYSNILIIILAGRVLPDCREQAFRHGADYIISKEDDSCVENILTRVAAALAVVS